MNEEYVKSLSKEHDKRMLIHNILDDWEKRMGNVIHKERLDLQCAMNKIKDEKEEK